MRRGSFAFASLAAVAMATPVWAGDVTVIETSEGSKPIAIKKDVSALAAVPKMADGKENQGFTYGALYELPGAGIRVMRGHIDPKGFVAVHQGAIHGGGVIPIRLERRRGDIAQGTVFSDRRSAFAELGAELPDLRFCRVNERVIPVGAGCGARR